MSIFDKDNNAFNLVRLIAAIMVVYSHSYAIALTPGTMELIHRLTGVTHAGELSVVVFFFLSGALVTKSLVSARGGLLEYAGKRILRIYPALIVCCFLSAFVFSWMFGGAPFSKIIHSESAWTYFIDNSISIWNQHVISGVYETHPSPGLNGSLWSVTLEVRLYFFLALLYMAGFITGPVGRPLVFLGVIGAIGVDPHMVPLIGNDHLSFGNYDFPVYSCVFLLGGIFYLLEKDFSIGLGSIVVFALAVLLLKGSGFYRGAIFCLTIVISLWFATRKPIVQRFKLENDYSYGIYLYGWPAQQIAYSILIGITTPKPYLVTLLAVPLAFGFAALSWHFIERPCIRLAHRGFSSAENNVLHTAWTSMRRAFAEGTGT